MITIIQSLYIDLPFIEGSYDNVLSLCLMLVMNNVELDLFKGPVCEIVDALAW